MRVTYVILFLFLLLVALPADAALFNDINQAFSEVHGRNPTTNEWNYWANRVVRGEKKTYAALVGAIGFQKAKGQTTSPVSSPVSASVASPAVGSFKVASSLYPSKYGPNFLPEGTLIKSSASSQAYYVKNGRRSIVLPNVMDRWLTEAHFFNHSVIVTLSPQDFARYKPIDAKNPTFIGKVLRHPNGSQFYIDDKYRKRPLSASVRAQLKFPGSNLYPASAAILRDFPTGPALNGKLQPGGMIIYDGPYHGGRIWRLQEISGGKIAKRLYLADRFYEAEYYPDEGQRVGVSAAELSKYVRGANIGTYPNGWAVSLGGKIFITEGGRLRHITSPAIFNAMGYRSGNVQKAFPEFLNKLGRGHNISAFKSITDSRGAAATAPAPAPNVAATSGLTRVNSTMRSAIAQVNPLYRAVFDKEITPTENRFWSDYVHSGEVQNATALRHAMSVTKSTGKKPGKTCHTCSISSDTLKNHWFPYLFHYTWRRPPSSDDTNYWHARVDGGRNTIQKLNSNIQWLKQSRNRTSE